MRLRFGEPITNTGATAMPGVFIDEATIAKVEDTSGKKQGMKGQFPPYDLSVELTFDIGKTWQPKMTFGGDFDKKNGVISGWGKARGVDILFQRFGIKGTLDENNRLSPEDWKKLVGMRVYKLSYVKGRDKDGKLQYGNFKRLQPQNPEGRHALLEEFKESLKKGYPKDYHPEVMDSQPTPVDEFPPKESDPVGNW